ncbi:hypothetical protein UT300012_22240 [Paraclostridium bifermentans]
MKKITTTRTKEKTYKMLRNILTISKVCIAVTCGAPGLLYEEEVKCIKKEEKNSKRK